MRDWPGNCHGIALLLAKTELVPAGSKVRYGFFVGEICADSLFARRPLARHGWIETPDGTIIDPTRWAFEHAPEDTAEAYVWVGEDRYDEYDVGMNAFKKMIRTPCPGPEIGNLFRLRKTDAALVAKHCGGEPITDRRAMWVANLSPEELGEDARPLFEALQKAGKNVWIPIDNWQYVME